MSMPLPGMQRGKQDPQWKGEWFNNNAAVHSTVLEKDPLVTTEPLLFGNHAAS